MFFNIRIKIFKKNIHIFPPPAPSDIYIYIFVFYIHICCTHVVSTAEDNIRVQISDNINSGKQH